MSEVHATIIVAGIAAAASVIASLLAYASRKAQDTGNGHTIGQGVARIEEQLSSHENRLDRIEVRVVEDMGLIQQKLNDVIVAKEHDHAELKERLTHAVFENERHLATYRHERRYDG